MKRKMFFRLAAVCMVAVSVLIACTKDYSSDIKALQDKVDALSQQVTDLQNEIDAGSVITSVEAITNGTRVTLSNGKTFDVTNGADGADGEDGEDGKDGTVWSIGDNGNWYCDGVDSGKPSRGVQGEQGLKGDTGASAYEVAKANGFTGTEAEWLASLKGDKGDKGTNGDYFYPCTDKSSENYGKWIKVNGETGAETVTDTEWLPLGTITAVWDEDEQLLTLHNVEGADEGIVEISLSTDLRSLAVIPEVWDATLGMPMTQVYAITPSAWETYRLLTGKAGNFPRLLEWHWPDGAFEKLSPAGWEAYFWCALYSSYLGSTGQQSAPGYSASWDINTGSFNYNWRLASSGDAWEGTYADLKAAVEDAIADLGKRFDNVSKEGTWLTRQPPVSALNIKYRVNPAGANVDDYQFRMIDRTLTVSTKADGDNYNHTVAKLDVEKSGSDQVNATGYIDYFKYWADQPTEWFLRMFSTKSGLAWYYWDAFDGYYSIPNKPRGEKYAMMLSNYIDHAVNAYRSPDTAAKTAMENWQEMNGISYETIVALEASKNGKGAEAIVSDYSAVKLDFVYPIWTAYRRGYSETYTPASSWPIAPNWGMYFASGLPSTSNVNDYLVEGQTYDVASHMRFADPYYGRLEDLGFEVKYDYYVFQQANSEGKHDYGGSWADAGGSPSGETETNYGGWDKVTVSADGKVSVKEGAEQAIGKIVIIVADASIKNEALGTYYNAAVQKASPLGWDNGQVMVDEFIGHYILLIVPDSSKTINVEYDLGDIDYLTLSQSKTAPAAVALEALDMDLEGFNNIYGEPVLTTSAPAGYSGAYQAGNANMFNVTLNNKTALGEGYVTYSFSPKVGGYSTLCYTIKWNITIDWKKLEPVLNPDYILYDDAARTDLTETIITTPAGVDSIVAVKGKDVEGTWVPQSSIREHILEYGRYLAPANPNVSNLSMSLTDPQAPTDRNTATIFSTVSGSDRYTAQEIKMTSPYDEFEEFRDYAVDMNITLANGYQYMIKQYIVRFICPIKLVCDDVTLETHKTTWCADSAAYKIIEVGTDKVLYDYNTKTVSAYATATYSGIFADMAANAPVWAPFNGHFDDSFGGNLLVEDATGWFYWQNDGTDLQVDKYENFKVSQNFPKLAKLAAKGNITVLSTAHSHSAHIDHAEVENPEPGSSAHETYYVIYE